MSDATVVQGSAEGSPLDGVGATDAGSSPEAGSSESGSVAVSQEEFDKQTKRIEDLTRMHSEAQSRADKASSKLEQMNTDVLSKLVANQAPQEDVLDAASVYEDWDNKGAEHQLGVVQAMLEQATSKESKALRDELAKVTAQLENQSPELLAHKDTVDTLLKDDTYKGLPKSVVVDIAKKLDALKPEEHPARPANASVGVNTSITPATELTVSDSYRPAGWDQLTPARQKELEAQWATKEGK